jgi:hypothetical protein
MYCSLFQIEKKQALALFINGATVLVLVFFLSMKKKTLVQQCHDD